MKYEYMKEYEVSGKRPEGLADDVVIEWVREDSRIWHGIVLVSALNWEGGEFSKPVGKFRIVDERFKPASDTDIGNNWHERGERPPVGEACEVSNCGQPFEWCEIKYMGSTLCVVDLKCHSDQHFYLNSVNFRPIRTERDVLIKRGCSDLAKATGVECWDGSNVEIETLIAADWRPIKRQSEEEFLKQCVDICEHGGGLHLLYRAGCRFIEQGE